MFTPNPLINCKAVANTDLEIIEWATTAGIEEGAQRLQISLSERLVAVENSSASGEALVSNGKLGADLIRLTAGEGFTTHTHPGDHLLITIGGEGTVTYGGKIYPTRAGQIYMIDGNTPHAVGAVTDHVILAVGCPHRAIDAADRMEITEYASVMVDQEELHCLICNTKAVFSQCIHELGCPHCMCPDCTIPGD